MELKFELRESEIQEMIDKLVKVDLEANKRAYDIIKVCTDKLLDESVKRTPIDEGFLVESHYKRVEKSPTISEITGIVYIPANAPASDYAMYIHEGEYNLGPHSLAKQGMSTVKVGRKFLERALSNNKKAFEAYIYMKLKELIDGK